MLVIFKCRYQGEWFVLANSQSIKNVVRSDDKGKKSKTINEIEIKKLSLKIRDAFSSEIRQNILAGYKVREDIKFYLVSSIFRKGWSLAHERQFKLEIERVMRQSKRMPKVTFDSTLNVLQTKQLVAKFDKLTAEGKLRGKNPKTRMNQAGDIVQLLKKLVNEETNNGNEYTVTEEYKSSLNMCILNCERTLSKAMEYHYFERERASSMNTSDPLEPTSDSASKSKSSKNWSKFEEMILIGIVFDRLFSRGSLNNGQGDRGKMSDAEKASPHRSWLELTNRFNSTLKKFKNDQHPHRTSVALMRHYKVMKSRLKPNDFQSQFSFRQLYRKYESLKVIHGEGKDSKEVGSQSETTPKPVVISEANAETIRKNYIEELQLLRRNRSKYVQAMQCYAKDMSAAGDSVLRQLETEAEDKQTNVVQGDQTDPRSSQLDALVAAASSLSTIPVARNQKNGSDELERIKESINQQQAIQRNSQQQTAVQQDPQQQVAIFYPQMINQQQGNTVFLTAPDGTMSEVQMNHQPIVGYQQAAHGLQNQQIIYTSQAGQPIAGQPIAGQQVVSLNGQAMVPLYVLPAVQSPSETQLQQGHNGQQRNTEGNTSEAITSG